MVVAGAKGLAKELLEIFAQTEALSGLAFFDNVTPDSPDSLFDRFPIIHSYEELSIMFQKTGDTTFALGLGNPILRQRVCREFTKLGGILRSVISPKADIGIYGINIGSGCCILSGAVITSSVSLGRGCLVNPNVTISHDSVLGDFIEVSPGVNITGGCSVGDYSSIGANAVILPRIRIGKNVVVGAGAVVTRDVPDNCMVAGVPAVIKKQLPSPNFDA